MRRHTFVVTFAVGALALGACKKSEPIHGNPPMPEPVIGNPPAPEPEVVTAPTPTDPSLPTWDDVKSGHPEGATNPPIPHLVVKPDGSCYKLWRSPMMRTEPARMGNYVDPDCTGDACGTQIQCTDEAAKLLEAWKASGGADPEPL